MRPLPAWIAVSAHLLTAAGSLLLVLIIHSNFDAQQAAQQRAGQRAVQELCTDLGTMARIPPPVGSAGSNPSRGYEQDEHQTWSGLYSGLGCRGGQR